MRRYNPGRTTLVILGIRLPWCNGSTPRSLRGDGGFDSPREYQHERGEMMDATMWFIICAGVWLVVSTILWGIGSERGWFEGTEMSEHGPVDSDGGCVLAWPLILVTAVCAIVMVALAWPFVCLGRFIGSRAK